MREGKKARTMLNENQMDALVPYKKVIRSGPQHLPQRLRFWIETRDNQIELALRDQLVIGRRSSAAEVDVDLTPYEAFEKGISRCHARIEVSGDRVMLRDMHSINGTRLNGEKLTAEHVYELHDGDIIQLGMLLVRIFFVAVQTTDLSI